MADSMRPNVRIAPMYQPRKRGYQLQRQPWGWDIEWYDGKGTYVVADELRWWQIPVGFIRLWWEVRNG